MTEETSVTITPEDPKLQDINIDEYFKTVFSLSGEYQSIVSVEITPSEKNKDIIIKPPMLHGSYFDPFDIDSDAIQYRMDHKFYSTDDWDKIPPGRRIDVYKWKAPTPLIKTYKYLVKITYIPKPDTDSGSTRGLTESVVSKSYTQTVYSTWDKWQRILRETLQERSGWQD